MGGTWRAISAQWRRRRKGERPSLGREPRPGSGQGGPEAGLYARRAGFEGVHLQFTSDVQGQPLLALSPLSLADPPPSPTAAYCRARELSECVF